MTFLCRCTRFTLLLAALAKGSLSLSLSTSCDDENTSGAEGAVHGSAMLQKSYTAKTPTPEPSCRLPENGIWAEVRLTGLPAFQMAIRATNDPLSKNIRRDGYWEIQDISVWGKPGEALDIGGNIGYYTYALANGGWNVTTFEPMVQNREFIGSTLCRNPDIASRVKILPIGLGTKNQVCGMMVPKGNIGDGVMRCADDFNKGGKFSQTWQRNEFLGAGQFEVRRLDQVLKEEHIEKVDFVKIDVEGYECEVFKGSGDFLKTHQPRRIKSEAWQSMEHCNSKQYLESFEDAGYRIGYIDDPHCTKKEVIDKGHGGDFYMCK